MKVLTRMGSHESLTKHLRSACQARASHEMFDQMSPSDCFAPLVEGRVRTCAELQASEEGFPMTTFLGMDSALLSDRRDLGIVRLNTSNTRPDGVTHLHPPSHTPKINWGHRILSRKGKMFAISSGMDTHVGPIKS